MKAEEKELFHCLNIVNEEGTGDTKWFGFQASAHLSRDVALRKGQEAEANQATGERCAGLGRRGGPVRLRGSRHSATVQTGLPPQLSNFPAV